LPLPLCKQAHPRGDPSLGAIMHELAQQIVSGLATGSVFASLALALVLIYRAMGVINFAQGELAMFTTYIAWQLVQAGVPMWAAFLLTLVAAFAIGVALERLVIRPVQHGSGLSVVIVTLGLFIAINGLAGWIWGFVVKPFPTPFSTTPVTVAGVGFSQQDLGVIVVSLITLGLITLFFNARAWDWPCAPRRSIPSRAACWGSASAGCSRLGGGWQRSSARCRGS
jgi:branched-chain amino acid transport system permease protein